MLDMVIHIYVRHSLHCAHRDDPTWKRCHCTKWIHYSVRGKQLRESTKARSWEQATAYARSIELAYEHAAAGERPKPSEPATVIQAVAMYLDDKRDQKLSHSTIRKREHWFEDDLLEWCHANGIVFVRDLDLNQLRKWRSTWKLGALASEKKQAIVRQFFGFCVSSHWITENSAKGLSRIKVKQKQTDYFTDEEFEKITAASTGRLLALVLLMRWSGLAIRDAVTLERSRLNGHNQIFLYRAKTNNPVHVTIPPDVADFLRSVPSSNPRYFFWTGNGKPESAVAHWQRKFRAMFKIAKLRREDGTLKRAHPHMLRDTFAVNLLICGVPLDQVQKLLGHSSIKTTDLHYNPWVKARMDQMDENVRLTWANRTIQI